MASFQASIVIPSWNGAAFVVKALEKILLLEGVEWEAVVVDHGRQNLDTEKALQNFSSSVRYIGRDEQLGFAGAVNLGVSLAKYDLVAVICNDVLVEKDWLRALLAAYEKEKQAGRSPVLFSSVQRPELPNPRRARMNFWFRVVEPEGVQEEECFFHPDGSAFLFDRSVYGLPFDGDYFLYQEDVYLGWRAWLMGHEVKMVKESRAVNFDGGTTKRKPYQTSYLTERNRWLNYFSFLSFGVLLQAFPVLILDFFLKFIFGKNRLAKMQAIGWLLCHIPIILSKRHQLQSRRKRTDREILPLLSRTYVSGSALKVENSVFNFFISFLGLPLGK